MDEAAGHAAQGQDRPQRQAHQGRQGGRFLTHSLTHRLSGRQTDGQTGRRRERRCVDRTWVECVDLCRLSRSIHEVQYNIASPQTHTFVSHSHARLDQRITHTHRHTLSASQRRTPTADFVTDILADVEPSHIQANST
mmetsp:Transcript_35860/g.103136  ORF Transcript_35860/g.103136 Transcript_35860/m.103136 type:complete len:138 (-) Transcript_35860:156-569(-)